MRFRRPKEHADPAVAEIMRAFAREEESRKPQPMAIAAMLKGRELRRGGEGCTKEELREGIENGFGARKRPNLPTFTGLVCLITEHDRIPDDFGPVVFSSGMRMDTERFGKILNGQDPNGVSAPMAFIPMANGRVDEQASGHEAGVLREWLEQNGNAPWTLGKAVNRLKLYFSKFRISLTGSRHRRIGITNQEADT